MTLNLTETMTAERSGINNWGYPDETYRERIKQQYNEDPGVPRVENMTREKLELELEKTKWLLMRDEMGRGQCMWKLHNLGYHLCTRCKEYEKDVCQCVNCRKCPDCHS